MPGQDLVAFIHRLNENPGLQEQVQRAVDFRALQGIAAAEGFNFSEKEWNAASDEALKRLVNQGEIGAQELDEVTGGTLSFSSQNVLITGLSGMSGGSFSRQKKLQP